MRMKLEKKLGQLKRGGKSALILYVSMGDPTPEDMMLENQKRRKIVLASLITLGVIKSVSGSLVEVLVAPMTSIICSIYNVVVTIAASIAALIIVIQGVKWIVSENDPGARKQAKDTIINAIIGLIIITVANMLVELVLGRMIC